MELIFLYEKKPHFFQLSERNEAFFVSVNFYSEMLFIGTYSNAYFSFYSVPFF
jgi:hypothetical protein